MGLFKPKQVQHQDTQSLCIKTDNKMLRVNWKEMKYFESTELLLELWKNKVKKRNKKDQFSSDYGFKWKSIMTVWERWENNQEQRG